MENSFGNNISFRSFVPVFQKQPFLYLFIFQAFGIIVGNLFYNLQFIYLLITSCVLLFLIYLNTQFILKKISLYLGLALMFFFLGYLTIFLFQKNAYQIESIETTESFQIKIIEFQPRKEGWSKGIGEIRILNDSKTAGKKERIVFYCKTEGNFDVNDILLVNSELVPIENKNNPGEFNMELFWSTKGIRKMCFFDENSFKLLDRNERTLFQNFIFNIQKSFNQILEKHLKGENLAIAKAIVLGDKSMLDTEIKNSFSATGAMHVLAVSGLHIGLILQILMELAKFFSRFISRKTAVFSILILLWIYSILTGFSPSVIRSIFMFSVLVLSEFYGKKQNNMNSLFFSAFVLLLFEPMFLYDIGFQLSYLAMVGIYTLYKPIEKWYQPKNKILKYFWQGTAVGFAAQFMTVPLTLYYFHQFPNYFAIANLGLMVISGLVLGLGIALFVLHYIPFVGKLTGFLLLISIAAMLWFIQWVEHLPGAVAYGFNLPFILVPVLSVITFLLVKLSPSQLVWKLLALSFCFSLLVIVYERWNSLTDNHICLFNNNKLAFIIKSGNIAYCFYNDDSKNLDKLKFTTESYLKCYPGKIVYKSIKDKTVRFQVDKVKISILKDEADFILRLNNRKIRIIHSNERKSTNSENLIYMPWFENDNSLRNGSRMLEF